MGRLSGRRGRDVNLVGEAVLLTAMARSLRRRGRLLTVDEAAIVVESYAELWRPRPATASAAKEDDYWQDQLAAAVGDREWARSLRQAAVARRDRIDWDSVADLARLVWRGELRRRGTVARYLQRMKPERRMQPVPSATPNAAVVPPPVPLPPLPAPPPPLPPPWEPPPPSPSAFRAAPQLPKAEKAEAAPDRTGCPPFRRPHRHRPEPPACVPDVRDYVPALVAPR